jgi:sodium transport system permease protein
MKLLSAVLRKELKDCLRDRRSVFAALLFPLMVPLVLGIIFGSRAREGKEGLPLEINLAGAEHAPSLVAFLEQQGATIHPAPENFELLVRDGKLDAVMVISQRYGEEFLSARPAKLDLIADFSRRSSEETATRISAAIARYNGEIAGLRLLARGVSPEVAKAVDLQAKDLSTPESRSAALLSIVPIYLLTALCIGGIYGAVDMTAGERERGSLEALLLNPVPRQTLVSGKWLVVALLSAGSFSLTLATSMMVLNVIPLRRIGISLGIGAREVLTMVAIALPLALFMSALELLLATFARTVREGQTYLSLLPLAGFVPGLLMEANHVHAAAWMTGVPVLGQQVLFSAVMRGESGPPFGIAISALVSLALAAICLRSTTRLLVSEKIVFGR